MIVEAGAVADPIEDDDHRGDQRFAARQDQDIDAVALQLMKQKVAADAESDKAQRHVGDKTEAVDDFRRDYVEAERT